MPPSARGFSSFGRSYTDAGANDSPSSDTSRPVAFATATISIADFVPSRNELNILGLKPPVAICSGVKP